MTRRLSLLGLALVVGALLLGLCGPAAFSSPVPYPSPGLTPASDSARLANPAAEFCEKQGYRWVVRTSVDGSQPGICVFPNGSECDEWAYFRGECGPTSR